jgi:hypothetical protein
VRNGPNSAGTPTFRGRVCGRRFVADPKKGPISSTQQARIERLLGERLGLRAIDRITGRSRSWLQQFVNDLYQTQTPLGAGTAGTLQKNGNFVPELGSKILDFKVYSPVSRAVASTICPASCGPLRSNRSAFHCHRLNSHRSSISA